MHTRKPAERKPTPAKLAVYLRDAQPAAEDVRQQINGGATAEAAIAAIEARRVTAVKALHGLFRRWRAEVKAVETAARVCAEGPVPWPEETDAIEAALQQRREFWVTDLHAPPEFDRDLRNFFDRAGRVIFASPAPLTAMRVFWKGTPRRGRRGEDNAERDFDLAVEVQQQINGGTPAEAAIALVAEKADLSSEAVHKVYYRRRLEARAALTWKEIWERGGLTLSPDPLPETEGREIRPGQPAKYYSALAAAEYPVEDNIGLWIFFAG